MRALGFTVAVALCLAAAAQERTALPQPDPGNVTLTLDEFNRLWELAGKPPKKPETPPLPYALKHAEIKLTAGASSVSGTVQFQGEVLKKGVAGVPLTTGLTVFNAHQDGKDLPLKLEDKTVTAVLGGPAEFALSLDVGQPFTIEAGRASLSLPVPAAGSVSLSLAVPGEYTSVNLSPGLITSRTSQAGNTTIEATLVPGQTSNIWWTTRETATVAPAVREAHFLSDVKTLVAVTEAEMTAAVLADITVVQGEPSEFEAEIPPGYEVTGTEGSALDGTEQKPGVLILKLAETKQKTYQFLISLEKPLAESKSGAPIIAFKGAQRETGEVLVESTGSTEITASESGGLKRIDIKEVNPNLQSLALYPTQAAFRYHRQPNENPALALDWVRFPDSSVLAALAENAEVTTLVTSEGKSLTEVKLTVKNQAQPFLKVDLPPGASILSADVAGEKVKPVEAPDGSRVPLLRAGFRPNGAYPVSFVFMHSGAPFARKGGSDISLPRMDVPIDLLQWEIFLPEQYKVKDFTGDAIAADRVPPAFTEGAAGGEYSALSRPVSSNYEVEQLLAGQLGGIVVDPSGSVIPNARVSVTNSATGYKMDAVTNAAGFWRVWNVPSGTVQVRVDANGFRNSVGNYVYDAQRPGAIATTLNVGAVSETVEVTAGAVGDLGQLERDAKKQAQAAQAAPSANVVNLQRRVAGVLPIAIDVPRSGTAFHFVRPLVVDEETKVSFAYKSK